MSAEQAPADVAPVVADAPAAPAADAAPEMFFRIESRDKEIFKISADAVGQSDTLKNLVGTLEYTAEDVDSMEPIPIENLKADVLGLSIKWCEHHKGEPIPVDDDSVPKNVVIPDWDAQLMDVDNQVLFDLICAANFLNIKGLLNVSCKKVANMAKGKSPEELRIIYAIPTDEEDEAAEKAEKEKREKEAAEKKAVAAKAVADAEKVVTDAGEGTSSSA